MIEELKNFMWDILRKRGIFNFLKLVLKVFCTTNLYASFRRTIFEGRVLFLAETLFR